MTGRQIYGLMRRQMLLIGGLGLGGGIVLGGALSSFLIPGIIKSLGIDASKIGDVMISFHLAVFLLTIFLVGTTVFAASRKPAKITAMCSPIEALGYRPESRMTGVKKSQSNTVSVHSPYSPAAKRKFIPACFKSIYRITPEVYNMVRIKKIFQRILKSTGKSA